jgi:tetratricopeptide (TPR) repeat protein
MMNNPGNLSVSRELEEAEEIYQQALDKSEETLRHNHPLLFRTVIHLGVCLLERGNLDWAETMLERVLKGREKADWPNDLSTPETAHNLGKLYSKQGKNAEAESMLLRALEGGKAEL